MQMPKIQCVKRPKNATHINIYKLYIFIGVGVDIGFSYWYW